MMYFDEAGNIDDKTMKKATKIIDKGYIKKRPSILFWRLVPHRHKPNAKITHQIVSPGVFCARCWKWKNYGE